MNKTGKNQWEGALTAAILEAIKQPNGMKTSDLKAFTVPQIGRMVQRLQSRGLVFRAPMPGKYGRYFDTMARAEEFANANVVTATVTIKSVKSAWEGLPAFIPDGLEAEEIPCDLHHRHTVFDEDEVPPLFSSLKPGQYIAPAPAWLQGVAA